MMINRIVGTSVALVVLLSCVAVPVWADRDRRDKDRQSLVKEKKNGQAVTEGQREKGHRSRQKKKKRDYNLDNRYRDKDRRSKARKKKRGYQLDKRHRHDRHYPRRGRITPILPRGYRAIRHRGKRYYHHHGTWYRHSGVRFIVVLPPVGITVPILPPFYTTIWVGGVPYYYANGVYYVWRPTERVYVVTGLPLESEVSEQPAKPAKLFIYPKKGQSKQQQATDRYQCHQWSVDQAGYDPTRSGGNVPESEYFTKRADYQRAMKACLEARGYSVQ